MRGYRKKIRNKKSAFKRVICWRLVTTLLSCERANPPNAVINVSKIFGKVKNSYNPTCVKIVQVRNNMVYSVFPNHFADVGKKVLMKVRQQFFAWFY